MQELSNEALIRRENLNKILGLFKSKKKLSDKLNQSPAYVHQILSGHRSIGEKAARKIELSLDIDKYSLDKKEELIKIDTNKIEDILSKNGVSIESFIKSLDIDSEEWGDWKENGVPADRILAVANVLDVESGDFLIQPEYKDPDEQLGKESKSPELNYLIHIINECERALNDSGKTFTSEERTDWYFKALDKAGRDAYSNDLVKEMIRQLVGKALITK